MAVCVHCGVAKGKRACPALGGEICAPCCGKHRLVDIACPADCRWLGGLAAIAGGAPAVAWTDADEDAAVARLIAFSESAVERESSRAALCALFGVDRVIDEAELARLQEGLGDTGGLLLTLHVGLGHRADDGTRAIDRFLLAHGRDLTPPQVAALVALQGARASLFHVKAAQAGVGLVLVDRLGGDVLTLAGADPRDVETGQLVYAWLVQRPGALRPFGPMITVRPAAAAEVERRLAEGIAGTDDAERRKRLAGAAPLVLHTMHAVEAAAAAP